MINNDNDDDNNNNNNNNNNRLNKNLGSSEHNVHVFTVSPSVPSYLFLLNLKFAPQDL